MINEMKELEKKIEKAQQKLFRAKQACEVAEEQLHDLLEEKALLANGLAGGKISVKEWNCSWHGEAVWDNGRGTVDCDFHAEMTFRLKDPVIKGPEVRKLESNKPGFQEKDVVIALQKSLKEELDSEFEDYCSEDDYYQPVVEDFDAEYYARKWAEERGLELIGFEGTGTDGEYEPRFRRW